MATIATLPFVSPEGGLSRYLVEIQKFPLLTVSEEAPTRGVGVRTATATPHTVL